MMTRPSLLFYCQHSLAMGHLVRSLALADSLADHFRVMFLNGGRMPKGLIIPAGVQVINLPPLGIDETNQLVSHDKRISVERALDRRKKMLRQLATCRGGARAIPIRSEEVCSRASTVARNSALGRKTRIHCLQSERHF